MMMLREADDRQRAIFDALGVVVPMQPVNQIPAEA